MGMGMAIGQLADLAEAQQGLVTARQADGLGVHRRDLARLVRVGRLERVAHGVYRVAGAPRPQLLELRAAWFQLSPGVEVDRRSVSEGVVSHASAATIYRAGLLEPRVHHFSVPAHRRVRSRREDVVIHRSHLTEEEVAWVEEMLVTVPARTVADLCAQGIDGGHLAGVVVDLLERHLTDDAELGPALAPYAHLYGGQPGDGADFLAYLRDIGPGGS